MGRTGRNQLISWSDMQDFKELDEEDKCVMSCNKIYPYL